MKKMVFLAAALAACGSDVDANGDGRVSVEELCAATCACDGDACEAQCLSAGGVQWRDECREAVAQCVLDADTCRPCLQTPCMGDIGMPEDFNSTQIECVEEHCS